MIRTMSLLALAFCTTVSTAGPLQRLKERRSATVESVVVVKVEEKAKPAPAKELAKPAVTVIQMRNRKPMTVTVTPAGTCINCK